MLKLNFHQFQQCAKAQFTKKILYQFKPSRYIEKIMKVNKNFDQLRKSELRYNFGVYGIVFALCWGAVPFYKLFCEHFGLDGDLKQKDYSQISDRKMDIHRKFTLSFKAEIDPKANWDFDAVQREVVVNSGETALVFYRAYNKEDKPIIGFSTYQVYPEDASLYFSKIQCFCFNQQLLNPKEELTLPLYFYLEPEINDDPVLKETENIVILYRFFKSKNQDLAQLADEELTRIQKNKMILQRMRQQKQLGIVDDNQFKQLKKDDITEEQLEAFNEKETQDWIDSQQ